MITTHLRHRRPEIAGLSTLDANQTPAIQRTQCIRVAIDEEQAAALVAAVEGLQRHLAQEQVAEVEEALGEVAMPQPPP